tara:strand:- start:4909 stop:5016 length:108 start_codon:yes stop_codon:yes gene_type:complete
LNLEDIFDVYQLEKSFIILEEILIFMLQFFSYEKA